MNIRPGIGSWIAALMTAVLSMSSGIADAADQEPLMIFDFEDPSEMAPVKAASENSIFDIVQDYGVTHGANCLRLVGSMGQPWTTFTVEAPDKLKGYDHYDYIGMDIFNGMEEDINFTLEFFDADAKDYHTRCTLEGKMIHPGANHAFWKLSKLKRNNKEGSDWGEIEAKDKIRMTELKRMKLFFTPAKSGGDTKVWIDNIRLLPESAVNTTMKIALPTGAIAYKFGSKAFTPAGFTTINVDPDNPGAKDVIGVGVQEIGGEWPDNLTGNGLSCPMGDFSFRPTVPPGEYQVWISAGRILDQKLFALPYILEFGGQSLVNLKLTEREYFGEKGIFRYLRTQYSERPNALWLDYVEPEAQEFTTKITVGKQALSLKVSNMRLSAMVLVPGQDDKGFKSMCTSIRDARIASFNARTFVKKQEKPIKPAKSGAYSVWFPKDGEPTRPWSDPAKQASTTKECQWAGAKGERITQRLCITPWQDLGTGDLQISDFHGPGAIPAANMRTYYMNYRYQNGTVGEMSLLPWTKIRFETGITWAYWMWLKIPDDAAPGTYTATATFKADAGGESKIPITLTVHPFALASNLPVAYGMYYNAWNFTPSAPPEGFTSVNDFVVNMAKEQFAFMREIGFTTVSLPAPYVYEGELRTAKIEPFWKAAREAGMGATPDQPVMTTSLAIARRIGKELWHNVDEQKYDMGYVDRNPGVELKLPEFRTEYLRVFKLYKQWLDTQGMAVAMEVVDEPREVPNPWNRRRDEVIRYADWLKELGFLTFVTFMGDENSGKDYTPIAEHVDIISVHAWKSCERLMAAAKDLKKVLWLYNVGMDRFSWGFFNWANDSKARWEWHFCFPDESTSIGHPNPNEWYTPFTNLSAAANHAPYFDMRGGMTFRSDFFGVANGISDYAYVYTLEKAIEANRTNAGKTASLKKAKDLLASIKKAIPAYADVIGMVSPDSGALVGQGIDTPLVTMTDPWRASIAKLISELTAP